MTIEEAGKKIYDATDALGVISLPIEDADGHILAEDLAAKVTQPPFTRSAMDGYAVRYEDIKDISDEHPISLPVVRTIFAGDLPMEDTAERAAVRIMTGAAVPNWADVVIPQELTDEGEDVVTIYKKLNSEANCVPAGEDFFEGEILANKGTVIGSYVISTAVAGGITEVKVSRKIKAAVITTGSELIEPGESILPGQIYNSSKAFFKTRLKHVGCDVVFSTQVSDDPSEIEETIKQAALVADLIITTGGVSVGKKDYIPEVLESLGADNIFQGIRVKPGSPTMAAKYNDTILLCLSGNPYSAIAMFEMLFPYYEQKALGLYEMRLFKSKAVCKNGFYRKSKMRRIVRGILEPDGVYVPADQRNGQLQAGIGCNCLVDIKGMTGTIEAGEVVTVFYRR